jgi:predicted Zn-dependent protease
MRTLINVTLAIALLAAPAQAQFGNILDKINANKDKIVKGAKVAKEANREFTEDEEANIGRVVAARVLATYPLLKDDDLQTYVTLVGNTVAAYSSRPTLEWHFAVIDTPIVNAFSTPGGFVFVTSGTLKDIHSEAELAALLGHEIAHVTQKHILREIKRGNVISAGADLAQSATNGSALTDEFGRKVGQIAYDKLFNTGLGRADENEADRIGVQLADAAGYRAAAFVDFLETLHKLEGSSELKQLTKTHPSPSDRIATVKPLVKSDRGVLLAERYEKWMN